MTDLLVKRSVPNFQHPCDNLTNNKHEMKTNLTIGLSALCAICLIVLLILQTKQKSGSRSLNSTMAPKAFLYVYPFGPTNDQNRLWLRGDDNNWTEHCQYGSKSQFKTTRSAQVEGNSGTIVRRVPDEAMEVFIPNMNASGNNPQWLRHRSIPNGDWQFLGQIQIEGN